MGQLPEHVVLKTAEISSVTLLASWPLWTQLYTFPFPLLYPALACAYYSRLVYDERTLVLIGAIIVGAHALTLLSTRWSIAVRARVACRHVKRIEAAEFVLVRPLPECGRAQIVPIEKPCSQSFSTWTFQFHYQRYAVLTLDPPTFVPVAYPCDLPLPFDVLLKAGGDAVHLRARYGSNALDVPAPPFSTFFAEYVFRPWFLFQIVCVSLWTADGYWLWMLGVILLQVYQIYKKASTYLSHLSKLRALGCKTYTIQAFRDGLWTSVETDALYPGDIVYVSTSSVIPADMLLLDSPVAVKENMLKGGQARRDILPFEPRPDEPIDVNAHTANILFAGSTVVPCTPSSDSLPVRGDSRALAIVLRTGFGTRLGHSVRAELLRTNRARESPLFVPRFTTACLVLYAVAMILAFCESTAPGSGALPLAFECALIGASVAAFRDEAAYFVTPMLLYVKGVFDNPELRKAVVQQMTRSPRMAMIHRGLVWVYYAILAYILKGVAGGTLLDAKYWEHVNALSIPFRLLALWMVLCQAHHARAVVREYDLLRTAEEAVAPGNAEDVQQGEVPTELSAAPDSIPGKGL